MSLKFQAFPDGQTLALDNIWASHYFPFSSFESVSLSLSFFLLFLLNNIVKGTQSLPISFFNAE